MTKDMIAFALVVGSAILIVGFMKMRENDRAKLQRIVKVEVGPVEIIPTSDK